GGASTGRGSRRAAPGGTNKLRPRLCHPTLDTRHSPMTLWTLIRRSLRFHARAHVGVVLGAVIGSAAFIGALVVGDSVKGSLQERALEKLDGAYFALAPPDRVFSADLKWGILTGKDTVQWFDPKLPPALRWKLNPVYQSLGPTMLSFSGTASLRSGSARANHVQVFGVN